MTIPHANAPAAAPLISAIIPTRNESANIVPCIQSFLPAVEEGWAEVIVVDNFSDDDTAALCAPLTSKYSGSVRLIQFGPERSSQRNAGARAATGRFLFFVDADMRIPEETLREIRRKITDGGIDAFYVREVRIGDGWWIKVRNFERSFYDATCIDALRVIDRDIFNRCGGYDESMTGPEDWDMDMQILKTGGRTALTDGCLLHDERRLTFSRHLRKKAYYSGNFSVYQKKWRGDPILKKQFGFAYRFLGVFLEKGKWKRALRHPILMAAIWGERFCVGLVFLRSRLHKSNSAAE